MLRLNHDVEDAYKKADLYNLFGWKVMVANSSHVNSVSELGHKLATNSQDGVGLVYNIIGNKVKISTRGVKGTTKARELAEKFGGGGHNEAAGAFTDAKNLLELIIK
jgi:nanoRNase/pAp phosphatase (c-di-AMP/oligoRNAs hydrolase)